MQFDRNTLRCLFLDQFAQLTVLATRATANNPELDNQFAVLLESLNQTVSGLFDGLRVETLPPDLAEQSLDLLQRYKLLRDHCRDQEAQLQGVVGILRRCGLPVEDADFLANATKLDTESLPFSIAERVIATCDSEALRRLLGDRATEVANEDVLRGLDDLRTASERLKEREAQLSRRECLFMSPSALQSSNCQLPFAGQQFLAERVQRATEILSSEEENAEKECLVLLAGKDSGSKAKAKQTRAFSNDLVESANSQASEDVKTVQGKQQCEAQSKPVSRPGQLEEKGAFDTNKKFASQFTQLNSAMQEELARNQCSDKGTNTGNGQFEADFEENSPLFLSMQQSINQQVQTEGASEKQAFSGSKGDAANSEIKKLQEQAYTLQAALDAANERLDKEAASRRLIESQFDAQKQLCDIARTRALELQAALDRACNDAEKYEQKSGATKAWLKREAEEATGNVARLQYLLENALQEHREAAKTISGLQSELQVSRQRMLEFETQIGELQEQKQEAAEEARKNSVQAEKIQALTQRNEHAEQELQALRRDALAREDEANRLRSELSARQQQQSTLEQKIAELDILARKAMAAENLKIENQELKAQISKAAANAKDTATAAQDALAELEKSRIRENTVEAELVASRQKFVDLERGTVAQRQLAACQAQRADRLSHELGSVQAALEVEQQEHALAKTSVDQLRAEAQVLREQLAQDKQVLRSQALQMEELEVVHARERDNLEEERAGVQMKLAANEQRLSSSLTECNELRRAIQELECRTEELAHENESLKAQEHEIQEQRTELATLRQEKLAIQQQLDGAQQAGAEVAELRQALARSMELTDNQAAELRRMQQGGEAVAGELEKTRDECAQQLEQMEEQLEQAKSAAQALQDESARLMNEMQEIQAAAQRDRESLSDAMKQNSTLEQLIQSLKTESQQLKDSLDGEKASLLQQSVIFQELAENEGKKASQAEELAQQVIQENGRLQEEKSKLDEQMEQLRESRSELEKERQSLLSELQLSKSAARSLEESQLQADELERLSLQKDKEISSLRQELLSQKAEYGRSSAEIDGMKAKRAEIESTLAQVSQEADSLRKQAEQAEKNSEVLRAELAELRKSWVDKKEADRKGVGKRQSAMTAQQQKPSQRKPQIRPVFLDVNGKKRELSVQDDCQFFTLKNILMDKENKHDGYYSFVHGDQELQNDYLVKDVETTDTDPIRCHFERFRLSDGEIPIKVVYLNYRQKQSEVYYITAGTTALEFVQFLARVENFSEIKSISADQYFELVITKNIQDNMDEKYDLDWPILEFPGYKQSGVLRMKTDCLCQDAAEWREDQQGRIVRVISQ